MGVGEVFRSIQQGTAILPGHEVSLNTVVRSKLNKELIINSVAYVEMYLSIANFFSRFDMSLYKTDETTAIWIDSAAARIWKPIRVKIDSIKEHP